MNFQVSSDFTLNPLSSSRARTNLSRGSEPSLAQFAVAVDCVQIGRVAPGDSGGRRLSDRNDMNSKVVEEFRTNEGRVGGFFEGMPILILHTTGAKSHNDRIHPMVYLDLDGHR